MTAEPGRWLPGTPAQQRHAEAGRAQAEADWQACAIKISDELIGTNPYRRAAYSRRHHELLAAWYAAGCPARAEGT